MYRLIALLASGCVAMQTGGSDIPLRVATYNIQAGAGNLERTAETLRDLNADLIALQEVDVRWHERSAFADQANELARMLRMEVRFAPIYRQVSTDGSGQTREFGVALLSRYRVESWHNDSLTRLSTQEPNARPTRMAGLLRATVIVDGRPVRVLTTHLDYRTDPAVRHTQVGELLGHLDGTKEPTIMAGDLNAPPDAVELRPLLERLRDIWPPRDSGFTYPATAPVKRIDYILVSPHFRIRSALVRRTTASDHLPVIAELLLPN